MRKPATNFAAAAFTFATFTFAPIPAFAIQLGPFHLGVPLFGHHHQYRHLHMRAHAHEVRRHREAHHEGSFRGAPPHELTTRELSQEEARRTPKGQAEPAWPLLYPIGPLATMFQNILWGPAPSSIWPIGYETVFSSAFAQTPTEPDQCHQPVNAKAIIERLRGLIGVNADQLLLLQQLNHAIDTGSDRLGKSCPTEIPHEPMARLQLMLRQIEALTTV